MCRCCVARSDVPKKIAEPPPILHMDRQKRRHCSLCEKSFTVFKRRRECSSCGEIVCSTCLCRIEPEGEAKGHRAFQLLDRWSKCICLKCFGNLYTSAPTPLSFEASSCTLSSSSQSFVSPIVSQNSYVTDSSCSNLNSAPETSLSSCSSRHTARSSSLSLTQIREGTNRLLPRSVTSADRLPPIEHEAETKASLESNIAFDMEGCEDAAIFQAQRLVRQSPLSSAAPNGVEVKSPISLAGVDFSSRSRRSLPPPLPQVPPASRGPDQVQSPVYGSKKQSPSPMPPPIPSALHRSSPPHPQTRITGAHAAREESNEFSALRAPASNISACELTHLADMEAFRDGHSQLYSASVTKLKSIDGQGNHDEKKDSPGQSMSMPPIFKSQISRIPGLEVAMQVGSPKDESPTGGRSSESDIERIRPHAASLQKLTGESREHLRKLRQYCRLALSDFQSELAYVSKKCLECTETMKASASDAFSLFEKEYQIRRQYHNTLVELQGNIRTFCRLRPTREGTTDSCCHKVTATNDDSCVSVLPKGRVAFDGKEYEFDRCFGPSSTQADVFDGVRGLIVSAIDGFNVNILVMASHSTRALPAYCLV